MALSLWPERNRLIATLPTTDREHLVECLELVRHRSGDVLYKAGSELQYSYFPVSGSVSLITTMASGASTELALLGNEGIAGLSLFMGSPTAPNGAVVTETAYLYRLSEAHIRATFIHSLPLQSVLVRYAQALLMQMAQTALCTRHHSLEQQLGRWLLMILDRTESDTITITHEALSSRLGVRRESVTVAAGTLQAAGILSCSRGRIRVLNRRTLETKACGCAQTVALELSRLLPISNSTRTAREAFTQ